VNAAVAAVVLICHLVLAAVVILSIKGIEYLVHSGHEEMLLFDTLPLRYLFHLADIGIISVFSWHGLKEAALAFRGEPHG
jgi:hypothetical protein